MMESQTMQSCPCSATPRLRWGLLYLLSALSNYVKICDAAFAIAPSNTLQVSRFGLTHPPPVTHQAALSSLSATKTASESTTSSRLKRTTAFTQWAKENEIK